MNPPPPPTPHPFPHTPPPPPKKSAEALFAALLDLATPEDRERALTDGCAGDDALAAEVRALLAAHEAAGDFMKATTPLPPEVQAELARLKPEEAGDRIGPDKLLQQIGEGGFGVVRMAEQAEMSGLDIDTRTSQIPAPIREAAGAIARVAPRGGSARLSHRRGFARVRPPASRSSRRSRRSW